ncbi:MAG: hypothetical protein FWD73_05795 [Polyangiaceae bacterium]|nr:hypothetical protein [Polyangiaceae bacterium]
MGRRALFMLTVGLLGGAACYSTGDGTPPPLNQFYFPVGLQVSAGGSVLYAVNSDFDLQYSGGTLQSYDLHMIRRDALRIIADPNDPNVPIIARDPNAAADCAANPPVTKPDGSGERQPLGETCAPPVDSAFYFRDSAVIGALATGLLLSPPPSQLMPSTGASPDEVPAGTRTFDRLFAPVRGTASIAWANVARDTADAVAPEDPSADYAPFKIQCGQDSARRCDSAHSAGSNAYEPGNTRNLTMPGEPFGAAFSDDGTALVVTHQSDTLTSLVSTGLSRTDGDNVPNASLQFVLDGVAIGGIGIAAIPHDRDALPQGSATFAQPAFLETSRSVAEVDLLRLYADDGSNIKRPFLDKEAAFAITLGTTIDSRGIAIDPTPRMACKANVAPADPTANRSQSDVDADVLACARKPARVFIANRIPASLLVGEVGGASDDGGSYDPDKLVLHTSIPLSTGSAGPSNVYLAPIVDRDGSFALRVFVICYDASKLFILDPESLTLENVVSVGTGPFAMAFDPFSLSDVATHEQVPFDPREPNTGLRSYRFAYVASFTNSYVQLIDLDNAQSDRTTFETVVFTLGQPTNPKGT